MPEFSSFGALENYLKDVITNVLLDDVYEVVCENEVEALREVVYGAGTPQWYERRYSAGGMEDKGNMYPSVTEDLTLEVENATPLKPFSVAGFGYGNLDQMIEYGYGSMDKWYNVPRPFTQATMEKLASNDAHKNALLYGLVRRGITVK